MTGSQKVIKVVSILVIIVAILLLAARKAVNSNPVLFLKDE